MSYLNLKLIGKFELSDENNRSVTFQRTKSKAIFAVAALCFRHPVSRSFLESILWSNTEAEKAKQALRSCIHDIRTTFESARFTGFHADQHSISVDMEKLNIDLADTMKQVIKSGAPTSIVPTIETEDALLYGFDGITQEFDSWLRFLRRNFEDRLVSALTNHLKCGVPQRAERAAIALKKIDPTHEEAHRVLMQHYATCGNKEGAIALYDHLARLLAHEYGVSPTKETQELAMTCQSSTP